MNKLAFIIPTQNRPDAIEYCLEQQAGPLQKMGADIIIYDTSTLDDTMDVVASFAQKYSHLHYVRYTGMTECDAIDKKVFSACEQYVQQYDYLWFSSDGIIVDINKLRDKVLNYMEEDRQLIIYSDDAPLEKEYGECTSLLEECAWRMTSLSAVIVQTGILRRAMRVFPVTHAAFNGLWLPMACFYAIADTPFDAVYFTDHRLWSANPKREGSFWLLSGNALWQWGKVWCDAIDGLPPVYDKVKARTIRSHDEHLHLFSLFNLLRLKAAGNITVRKVRKYYRYIPRITDTKPQWFIFLALIPNRYLLLYCKRCYHKIAKFIRK